MEELDNKKGQVKKSKFDYIRKPKRFMLIIDIVCGLMILFALFFAVRHFLNEKFIKNYNDGNYSDKYEKILLNLNYPESYVANYNLGNVCYKNGEYDEAIIYYKKALEENPPHKAHKECDIRVNLSLSMLEKIDWDNISSEKDVEKTIRMLQAARNVLTEEGCANPDDPNGHDEDAEQLKKDIDDMIQQLQNPPPQQKTDNDQDDKDDQNKKDQDQQNNQQSKREQELKNKLDSQKTQSAKERQKAEEERAYKEMDKNGEGFPDFGTGDGETNTEDTGKNW